jgi:hypothetical protein
MTEEQKTELNYLLDIVLEASKWNRTPDDDRDCIRMEVEHRINVLTGREDSRDEDLGQKEEESNPNYWTQAKRNYTKTRVRVKVDGKNMWKPRSECRKEVMPGWTTKMHWVWYGPQQDKETQDEQ